MSRLTKEEIEKRYPHESKSSDPKVRMSDLKVMQSGAGFYIGREAWVEDEKLGGYPEPGSRESDYFATREEAEKALAGDFEVRESAENMFMYETGGMPMLEQLAEKIQKDRERRARLIGLIKRFREMSRNELHDMISNQAGELTAEFMLAYATELMEREPDRLVENASSLLLIGYIAGREEERHISKTLH